MSAPATGHCLRSTAGPSACVKCPWEQIRVARCAILRQPSSTRNESSTQQRLLRLKIRLPLRATNKTPRADLESPVRFLEKREIEETPMTVTVRIPTPLRTLTGGEDQVKISGSNVQAVIDNLEAKHPGIKERLVDDK